jgi:hypothetical protein
MLQGLAHFYADDQRRNSDFPGRGDSCGEGDWGVGDSKGTADYFFM